MNAVRTMDELPGPRALPLLGNGATLLTGESHVHAVERWAARYGPLFRYSIGPQQFVAITDEGAIREVLRARPTTYRRTRIVEDVLGELNITGLFAAEGDNWHRQRRLIMPAFKPAHIRKSGEVVGRATRRLISVWGRAAAAGDAIDVARDFKRFTVDVTTALTFDVDMNTVEQGSHALQSKLEKVFPGLERRLNFPVPYWRLFKTKVDVDMESSVVELRSKMGSIIADARERLRADPELRAQPSTILEALIVENLADAHAEGFSDDDVFSNMLTLLLAGEDTTAYMMAWMVHYMNRYPGVQDRARSEAQRVLGGADLLEDVGRVRELPYLLAVAQEVLRVRSSTPLLLFQPNEPVELMGVRLEPDTSITLCTRLLANRPESFSEPDRFLPERWIDGLRPPGYTHRPRVSVPFGDGPRICPGRSLAFVEAQVLLSAVLKAFEFSAVPGAPPVTEQAEFVVCPKGVQTHLRARTHVE